MQSWYLEGYFSGDNTVHRQSLKIFPFEIGRDEGLALTLRSASVSRRHAQLTIQDSLLVLEDLNSTNGTFKNHQRIEQPTPVNHGDILHLGEMEMRLMESSAGISAGAPRDSTVMNAVPANALSRKFPYGAKEFEQLLKQRLTTNVFQPIVNQDNSDVLGYEILGRGPSEGLPTSPIALFEIAESIGMEVALSELLRDKGVATAVQLKLQGYLFMNTHPSELLEPDRLMRSLSALRTEFPGTALALEIHEQAIADIDALRAITDHMRKLGILVAYDDFGVGQSRLLELVEATPDFLKFDMKLTSNIHLAAQSKFDLVKQLHDVAKKLGIKTVAECISEPEEYEVCKKVGFEYYQGFLFGRPRAPESFQAER